MEHMKAGREPSWRPGRAGPGHREARGGRKRGEVASRKRMVRAYARPSLLGAAAEGGGQLGEF